MKGGEIMTKKFIVFIFTACIALTCFTCSVSATVSDPNIVPMSTYYRSAYSKNDISTNGTVTIKGSITGYRGTTTKTSVHLYLQKYTNKQWSNVANWTLTTNSSSCALSKSKTVSKGKYRSKAVCTAYAGTKSEKITKYSTAITY